MRVITESVRGVTIHWPKGMPLAYMNKVLEHLAYDRCIKDWTYVGERILPADCFGHPILSKRED